MSPGQAPLGMDTRRSVQQRTADAQIQGVSLSLSPPRVPCHRAHGLIASLSENSRHAQLDTLLVWQYFRPSHGSFQKRPLFGAFKHQRVSESTPDAALISLLAYSCERPTCSQGPFRLPPTKSSFVRPYTPRFLRTNQKPEDVENGHRTPGLTSVHTPNRGLGFSLILAAGRAPLSCPTSKYSMNSGPARAIERDRVIPPRLVRKMPFGWGGGGSGATGDGLELDRTETPRRQTTGDRRHQTPRGRKDREQGRRQETGGRGERRT